MKSHHNMNEQFYPAFIHGDDAPGYGISFPDFRGCTSAGDTLEKVIAMGIEALGFYVEDMLEDGENLPTPSTIAEIMSDPELEEIRQDVLCVVHIPLTLKVAQAAE